jgi:biopolymer transport protein ExbD
VREGTATASAAATAAPVGHARRAAFALAAIKGLSKRTWLALESSREAAPTFESKNAGRTFTLGKLPGMRSMSPPSREFLKEDVKLPKASTADEEKDMGQYLVISVRADGAIFVDRDQTTPEAVGALVNQVRANRPLLVKGDQVVTFKQVRDAVDAIHQEVEGTDTILLAVEKQKGQN